MDFKFAAEKLTAAARTIMASGGTIQERLNDAFVRHLATLDPRDLPEELRPSFSRLQETVTWVATPPAVDDGTRDARLAAMSTEDAGRCADLILRLRNYVSVLAA
jgi:hypothetical protein